MTLDAPKLNIENSLLKWGRKSTLSILPTSHGDMLCRPPADVAKVIKFDYPSTLHAMLYLTEADPSVS